MQSGAWALCAASPSLTHVTYHFAPLSGENENGGGPERIEIMLPVQWVGLAVLAYMVYQSMGPASASQRTSEISFQEFKTKLLAQGMVAKLEVVNNTLARVYVRPDALSDSQSPQVRPCS